MLRRFALLGVLQFFALSTVHAQDVNECMTDALAITEEETSSFEVIADETIVELNVALELTTATVGNMVEIHVESPEGTQVVLHQGGGGDGDDMHLVYSDVGRINGNLVSPPGTQSYYDCDGCAFEPYPGEMSDCDGESTAGDWSLTIDPSTSTATLEEWCVINYPAAPVESVTCEPGVGTGDWTITWSNPSQYDDVALDAIEVRFEGEVVGTETELLAAGDMATVTSAVPLDTPQYATLEVVPVVATVDGAVTTCSLFLRGAPDAAVTTGPALGEEFEYGVPFVDLLTFDDDDDVVIEDIYIRIDMSGTFAIDVGVWVTSAGGTTVGVHDGTGGATTDVDVDATFWDFGIAYAAGTSPSSFDCDGCLMQPSPGSLSDLVGEETVELSGTWSLLAVATTTTAGVWTVNEWGIQVYEVAPAQPATIDSCAGGEEPGTVEVTFTPGSEYSAINLFMNGRLETTLDDGPYDDSTAVTWSTPVAFDPFDFVTIEIQGFNDADEPGATVECRFLVLEPVALEECRLEDGDALSSEIELFDYVYIQEVEAVTEVTSDFFSGAAFSLISPVSTTVDLHTTFGPTAAFESYVVWDDDGVPVTASTDFACRCALQPQGGEMADFVGEASDGTWTFSLAPGAFDAGIISWCLRVDGCPLAPPVDVACEWDGDGPYDVMVNWSNGDPYLAADGIEVYDVSDPDLPVLMATLDGDAETVTIEDYEAGYYWFAVRGMHPTEPCSVDSEVCRVAVGAFEECAEGVTPDAGGVLDSELTFVEPIQIGRTIVSFNYVASFGPASLTLESPSGTSVGLIETQVALTGSNSTIDIFFDDEGSAYTVVPLDDRSRRAPEGPGSLADFEFEIADGDWALSGSTFATLVPTPTLDWCLAIEEGCEALPPAELSCDWDEGSTLELEWSNSQTYDALRVLRDSVVLVEIDASAESYSDTPPIAGRYHYQVQGYDADLDCWSGSSVCEASFGLFSYCDPDPADPGIADLAVTANEVDVIDDLDVLEVRCQVDISHPWIGDLEVRLENPDSEEITMHDQFGASAVDIRLTYADSGVANTTGSDFVCECLMAPRETTAGTGSLEDLLTGGTIGLWTLDIEDFAIGNVGTLNSWCLEFHKGCGIEPPEELVCENTDGAYPVQLNWVNSIDDEYDSIDVFQNDVLVAEDLDGDADSFTVTSGSAGTQHFIVSAYNEEEDCASIAQCVVTVGRYTICESGGDLASTPGGGENFMLDVLDWQELELEGWDGSSDYDLSPDEDDRIDVAEVEVTLSFSTTWVGGFEWIVVSPEETTVGLWNDNGGIVTWTDDDAVLLADDGEPIPPTVSLGCTVDTCRFKPAGPGQLSDFEGEDARDQWTIVGSSFYPGVLEEWCVHVYPDELPSSEQFLRGDCGGNGSVSALLDSQALLLWAFADGDQPPCMKACDVDGNGAVAPLLDALFLLEGFFLGEDLPPEPYPDCGSDVDSLSTTVSCETPLDC